MNNPLTVAEAAMLLNLSETGIRQAIRRKTMEAEKIKGEWMIPLAVVYARLVEKSRNGKEI